MDEPLAIPCNRCPEFRPVVYPSTPNTAEEYDVFCDGHMDDDVFLMFMENRNDPEDTCPYLELLDRVAALEKNQTAALVVIDHINQMASDIRGDWTDPRYECRAIWDDVETLQGLLSVHSDAKEET